MAALDQTYRDLRKLDVIFGLSCLGLLIATLVMLAVDHRREWKHWQRRSRQIEVELLEQQAKADFQRNQQEYERLKEQFLKKAWESYGVAISGELPPKDFLAQAKQIVNTAENDRIREIRRKLEQEGVRERAFRLRITINEQKAIRDSIISQRDAAYAQGLSTAVVEELEQRVRDKQAEITRMEEELDRLQRQIEQAETEIAQQREPLQRVYSQLEANLREYDRLTRLQEQRQLDVYARIRALPILDAFASPFKIRQDVPDGLLIDYNFKQVQRVDRCASCHTNIDRLGFEKSRLASLTESKLSPAEIAVLCNHPRLDLFVGSNSPHPVEKFGCTICHSGQGGSTSFNFAYHFPDAGKTDGNRQETYADKFRRWEEDYHWHPSLHPNFLWDYPMVPMRFIEASCLKCHHEVMSLKRSDGREEAPKLLQGYRLVRELGCFGCHEISGYKAGRRVGPDLRLEPYPPLEELPAAERSYLLSTLSEPPGTLRKVGPGLRLIHTKLSPDWVARWIRSPRSFRYDTRMPHFFGQHNNTPTGLSDYQPNDESLLPEKERGYPDAEIEAMTFYLFFESRRYESLLLQAHQAGHQEARLRELQRALAGVADGADRYDPELPEALPARELVNRLLASNDPGLYKRLHKKQVRPVYLEVQDRLRLLEHSRQYLEKMPYPLGEAGHKKPYPPPELDNYKPDAANGEKLFALRGCLACHTHDKPSLRVYNEDGRLVTDSDYGPNLTQLKAKFAGNPEAAKWLYNWLTDPKAYSPRTRMPKPQFRSDPKDPLAEAKEKVDIIAWLLSDDTRPALQADGALLWDHVTVQADEKALQSLVRMYLEGNKSLARASVERGLKAAFQRDDLAGLRPDADEWALLSDAELPKDSPWRGADPKSRLQWYLGRKTIARYGCYGCHDIPGFEQAKPIGTPLNDWGKKDPEQLAFEQIASYLHKHFHLTRSQAHAANSTHGSAKADNMTPKNPEFFHYDPFYEDAVMMGRREGFLYQKLREPRSYDYGRLKDRPYEERLRMPQFRFSVARPTQQEMEALQNPDDPENAKIIEAYRKRAFREEEQAIEAVMTFILGLTAEPIPQKFVHHPSQDRYNEIRGTELMERYNCIGCHIAKPGRFVIRPEATVGGESVLETLRKTWTPQHANLRADFSFLEHNAWAKSNGPVYSETSPGIAFGLPIWLEEKITEDNQTLVGLELYEAFRFRQADGSVMNIPAGERLEIPIGADSHQDIVPVYGGQFAEILARLQTRPALVGTPQQLRLSSDRTRILSSVPPPLLREGQKVQPDWLLEFLRQPYPMRPPVAHFVRMPVFDLSLEERQALVNYFIAVDRINNPQLGLDYVAALPPQRDPSEQAQLRQHYRRLLERALSAKGSPAGQSDRLPAERQDYFATGWQLLTHRSLCLNCHNIGRIPTTNTNPESMGPDLSLAPYRLRPDYVERWVANPRRFLPYTSMPAYFPNDPAYPVAETLVRDGENRLALDALGSGLGYNALESWLFSPIGRVRAVRDAVMSWGFLEQPPPRAIEAGPPRFTLRNGSPPQKP
jgi:cbb3-type cytochrome oxidase cytochrome c subunit